MQINYALIKQDMLAIAFGWVNQFISCKQTDVETDHNPLVFKKLIGSGILRIQRLLLKLQPY